MKGKSISDEEWELYYESLHEASKEIAATSIEDKKPVFKLESEGKLFLAYFPLSLFTSEEKTKKQLRNLIDEARWERISRNKRKNTRF